ncbi:hypothetical protein KQI84_04365 [bacterium]|nr:hypothetical protein [bacterium]
MRSPRRTILTGILWLAMVAACFAQDAPAGAPLPITVNPVSAPIGDQIEVSLDVPVTGAAEALIAKPPKEQQGLLVIDKPKKTDAGWTIPVRLLSPGEQTIGPLSITAQMTDGRTQDFTTQTASVTIAEPGADPGQTEDYTPPLTVPFDWTLRNMAIGAMIIVAVLLAFLLIRALLKRGSAETQRIAPPPLPPLEEAIQSLTRLATMDVFQNRGTKAHYSELSYLLRRYFERQFDFQALEMSEDELIEYLRRSGEYAAALTELKPILLRASMAKFARWEANEPQAGEDISTARVFLRHESERMRATNSPEEGSKAA